LPSIEGGRSKRGTLTGAAFSGGKVIDREIFGVAEPASDPSSLRTPPRGVVMSKSPEIKATTIKAGQVDEAI
jgi:hypothetical protein